MKKLTFSIFFLIILITSVCSQDIIYKIDGTEIKTKIVEITLETIKYKKFNQLEGPIRNISLTDIFLVIYEDGTREVFQKDVVKQEFSLEDGIFLEIVDERDQTIVIGSSTSNTGYYGNITSKIKDKKGEFFKIIPGLFIDSFKANNFKLVDETNAKYCLKIRIKDASVYIDGIIYEYSLSANFEVKNIESEEVIFNDYLSSSKKYKRSLLKDYLKSKGYKWETMNGFATVVDELIYDLKTSQGLI